MNKMNSSVYKGKLDNLGLILIAATGVQNAVATTTASTTSLSPTGQTS